MEPCDSPKIIGPATDHRLRSEWLMLRSLLVATFQRTQPTLLPQPSTGSNRSTPAHGHISDSMRQMTSNEFSHFASPHFYSFPVNLLEHSRSSIRARTKPTRRATESSSES